MLILWLLLQLYLKWQGYSKHTKVVINSLPLCTVYSATPFCFHLRLSSALMETLRMTHWSAVLSPQRRELRSARLLQKWDPLAPWTSADPCPKSNFHGMKRMTILTKKMYTRVLVRKVQLKKMFFPAYPKKCVNVLDRISRQRQLLIKKMTFITQRK